MKRFLHPSFLFVFFALILFLIAFDVFWIVPAVFPSVYHIQSYIVPYSLFLFLFLLLLLYWITDYLLRYLKRYGDFRSAFAFYREDKHMRRTVNSYIGATINFGMAVFYLVMTYVHMDIFYGLTAQFFFLAFLFRSLLLYPVMEKKEIKETRRLFLSALFLCILAFSMEGIVLDSLFSSPVEAKSQYVMYLSALYGFIKFISAIVAFVSASKEKDSLLKGFSMISLALSFYSMYMLSINLPSTFSSEENTEVYGSTGLAFAFVLFVLSVIQFFHVWKLKKQEKR